MSGLAHPYNTPVTVSPQTAAIVAAKARTKPNAAAAFAAVFNSGGNLVNGANNLAGGINAGLQSLDKYTYNFLRTMGSNQAFVSGVISGVTGGISGGINNLANDVTGVLDEIGSGIQETLKPVSTAIGSVLGTLTGIAKDPLGSISMLPRTLADLVEKFNPGFAAKMEGTFKKYKVDNLVHLPGQIIGSIRNLMTIADAVLSLPFIILADLYQGLLDILEDIADIIDQIMTNVLNWIIENTIGALIPIDALLEFLAAVSELAAEIQGITTIFLGANPIAGFALDVQNYSRQLTSFFTSPQNVLAAYLPPDISNALYTLRNPQQLINSILPPQISGAFAQLASVIGVGFNGNMGYGFEAVLNTVAKQGVIGSILNGFAAQYNILTPLLGLTSGSAPGASLYPPLFKPSIVNPAGHPVTHGIPQPQVPQPVPVGGSSTSGGGSGGGTGGGSGGGTGSGSTGRLLPGQTATRLPDGRITVTNSNGSTFTVSENYFRTQYPNQPLP